MPAAHQPHRPRSPRWLEVLALVLLCAGLVALVWIAGPEHVFPSNPAPSASATPEVAAGLSAPTSALT
ncbi:MAG: hypothetical protein JO144_03090 [Actinobacteria bacterium]|nr:hypothetical protein [Actinomycetota bacterium]